MAKLSKIVIPRVAIRMGDADGQYFQVRGVNLTDLQVLMLSQAPQMAKVFEEFMELSDDGGFTVDKTKELIVGSIKKFPRLVAAVIALAAGEGDDEQAINNAAELPLGMQIEALENIMVLSIKSDAQLKKLVEIVMGWMDRVATAMRQANLSLSADGSGTSASA